MPAVGRQNGRMQARVVELLLGPAGAQGKAFRGDAHGFAIDADVSYSLDDVPRARISLYNPSDEAVGLMFANDAAVVLSAGYGSPQPIFSGVPVKAGVRVSRQGASRVLEIEAQDSYRGLVSGKARSFFPDSISYRDVVSAAAASVGLRLGICQIPEGLIFANGFSASGDATAIFQRVALSSQTFWNIENGAVNFLYRDESREPGSEKRILFSSLEGNLVGEPQWKEDGVVIKALLDPTMRPGMAFRFEAYSPRTGNFAQVQQVARDVTFNLSSRGTDFYVTLSSGAPKGSGGRPKAYTRGGPA